MKKDNGKNVQTISSAVEDKIGTENILVEIANIFATALMRLACGPGALPIQKNRSIKSQDTSQNPLDVSSPKSVHVAVVVNAAERRLT